MQILLVGGRFWRPLRTHNALCPRCTEAGLHDAVGVAMHNMRAPNVGMRHHRAFVESGLVAGAG